MVDVGASESDLKHSAKLTKNWLEPKNLTQLENYCQVEWNKITSEECYRLVENYNKKLQQVIEAKSYTIDY